MFILKRQDVEIAGIQHPKTGQQIPILKYEGQNFRLIQVFNAAQAEEAKAFWRDLTDNRGKACVLLEEPDRYSVWGKVRLEQIGEDSGSSSSSSSSSSSGATSPLFTQACLLLLQAVYFDIEDLLGTRQAGAFVKEMTQIFQKWNFPQAESTGAVKQLIDMDPLTESVPNWQEHHITRLLEELYQIGKQYFGNTSFAEGAVEVLQDMPAGERKQFIDWMNKNPLGKMWGVV